jgi:hypothetical protein
VQTKFPGCISSFLTDYLLQSSKILVGKPEGKRPLGRPRHGWEDNIKIDLKETE